MVYRRLGQSDLKISVIGLGTLALGGGAYGPVKDDNSIATIHRAIDLGINFIDTSDNYGLGHAEEVVGKAIKGRRDQVILATKGGTPWDEGGRVTCDCSPKAIARSVESSLRRLDTDRIDLYQIHIPDPTTPYEETARALERMVQAGKIRYVGVSNFWEQDLREWLAIGELASNQMPYNFLHRDIESSLLPLCRTHEIGVIAYTPLLMGLFAGKLALETDFGDGDHRAGYPQFTGQPLRQALSLVDRLRALAQEYEMTVAQLTLSWIISHPGITCAIAGAKYPEQVQENAGTGARLLSEKALKQIEQTLEHTAVDTPRLMPLRVAQVHQGARGRLGTFDIGISLRIPDTVQAGDVVQIDIVTGQMA